MGFAGVLSELGLPRSEFLPALVSFNVGVELGQLTVILARMADARPAVPRPAVVPAAASSCRCLSRSPPSASSGRSSDSPRSRRPPDVVHSIRETRPRLRPRRAPHGGGFLREQDAGRSRRQRDGLSCSGRTPSPESSPPGRSTERCNRARSCTPNRPRGWPLACGRSRGFRRRREHRLFHAGPQTGVLCIWFMDGLRRKSGINLPDHPPPPWRVAATGDFDGDGRPMSCGSSPRRA